METVARKSVEIGGGERYGKAFYRAEISLNFPTTCYSRRSKEGERERSRVNENLCGGTKRASRPRMHVRATNADRKSIKRLLHPRHSAAAPPHGNQPLSSLFIPALASLFPPDSSLSFFLLPLSSRHPSTLHRSVPATLIPAQKVSFEWPSKLENYPPKMHFAPQRYFFLPKEDVSLSLSTENREFLLSWFWLWFVSLVSDPPVLASLSPRLS